MRKLKLRPRIQREFLAWYRQNAHRFAIPLRLNSLRRKYIEFGFVSITPVISVGLQNRGDFGVHVKLDGVYFDALVWLDGYAQYTQQGYYNVLNKPEYRVFHPTRKEFWRLEMFEPFLQWVNEELTPARWVRLSRLGGEDGSTWATLIHDENELSHPDRTLAFVQSLKRIDGLPTVDRSDTLKNWLIPLRTQP